MTNLEFVRGAVANLSFAEAAFTSSSSPVAPTARASPNGKWIERLRDPSRVQMPPRGVVSQWLQEYGLEVGGVADWRSSGPVLPWLEQAVIDASAAALV